MDFRTAMAHYRSGSATDAERLLVEEEVEKNALISEFLDEGWSMPMTPLSIPKDNDSQMLSRKLRRRNIALVAVSLALSVSLVMSTAAAAMPTIKTDIGSQVEANIAENEAALNEWYWSPEFASYSLTPDLTLNLIAYTELFQPGIEIESVRSTHVDTGTYTLAIECVDTASDSRRYYAGSVVKNQVHIPGSYRLDTADPELFSYTGGGMTDAERSHVRATLAALPEYVTLTAAVSFPELMTMEQLIAFQNSVSLEVLWSGVFLGADSSLPPCGIDAFTSPLIWEPDWDSMQFPSLFLPEQPASAETLREHFTTLLRYCNVQNARGCGIDPLSRSDNPYKIALEFVEENGILTYGCVISGSSAQMLALLDSGAITQIVPLQAWIGL